MLKHLKEYSTLISIFNAAQTCDVNANVEPISGDCVTFYDEGATYVMSTGQTQCSSAGFNMAKIDTQHKVDFIKTEGILNTVR